MFFVKSTTFQSFRSTIFKVYMPKYSLQIFLSNFALEEVGRSRYLTPTHVEQWDLYMLEINIVINYFIFCNRIVGVNT